MKIYIDGAFYDKDEAKISVYDHGLLYGDGVFEGIRIYKGVVFKLREHLTRLYDSAKAILLTIPMDPEDLARDVLKTVQMNKKHEGYIRLIITRGKGNLGLNPFTCEKATVIIIVDDIQLYPQACYQEGIAIITASVRRMPPDCLDPKIKSLNYLNNIMAKIEAIQAGCLEALLLNREGYVTECTGDNIFYLKNKVLITPESSQGALEGITRNTVLDAAREIGIETGVKAVTVYDLYTADECFLTGTAAELIPVVRIDGRIIGSGTPGPLSLDLKKAFLAIVAGNSF
ncbi:MAG: branched-chain-amino-acid transaminase [Proteobacteria bacterium]|nr:branched-chain-amino-acid transaminase [Pseudomonadota bacterium]